MIKQVPKHYMTAEGIAKVNEQGHALMKSLRDARKAREARRVVLGTLDVVEQRHGRPA